MPNNSYAGHGFYFSLMSNMKIDMFHCFFAEATKAGTTPTLKQRRSPAAKAYGDGTQELLLCSAMEVGSKLQPRRTQAGPTRVERSSNFVHSRRIAVGRSSNPLVYS